MMRVVVVGFDLFRWTETGIPRVRRAMMSKDIQFSCFFSLLVHPSPPIYYAPRYQESSWGQAASTASGGGGGKEYWRQGSVSHAFNGEREREGNGGGGRSDFLLLIPSNRSLSPLFLPLSSPSPSPFKPLSLPHSDMPVLWSC